MRSIKIRQIQKMLRDLATGYKKKVQNVIKWYEYRFVYNSAPPQPEPEPEPVQAIKEVIQEAVKEEKKEFTIDFEKIANQSLFEFNSDKISEDNHAGLDVVANFLKETPNVSVKIEGHTDNVGSDEVNQRISENRAASVANTLKKEYKVKNLFKLSIINLFISSNSNCLVIK